MIELDAIKITAAESEKLYQALLAWYVTAVRPGTQQSVVEQFSSQLKRLAYDCTLRIGLPSGVSVVVGQGSRDAWNLLKYGSIHADRLPDPEIFVIAALDT